MTDPWEGFDEVDRKVANYVMSPAGRREMLREFVFDTTDDTLEITGPEDEIVAAIAGTQAALSHLQAMDRAKNSLLNPLSLSEEIDEYRRQWFEEYNRRWEEWIELRQSPQW